MTQIFYKCLIINLILNSPVTGIFDGLKHNVMFYTLSQFKEVCDERWITQDINGLEKDLEANVFGQELAVDVIIAALQSSLKRKNRQKPLALTFHGWPGTGKGHVTYYILKNWFKKGHESVFIRKYVAQKHFPLVSEIYNYQKQLQSDLEEAIKKCPKSVFVFDEVDKYPPKVLDAIKPYLDHSFGVSGLDFREAIFIFITNNGESLIYDMVLNKYRAGLKREELQLEDFEEALQREAYHDEGGFYQSGLLRHALIDIIVPFFPLERHHVEKCIEVEMSHQEVDYSLVEDIKREVFKRLTFGPKDEELFASHGCAGISDKVAFYAEKNSGRRQRRRLDL